MQSIWNKYAQLLTQYSLKLKKGERLYIKSTTLAEPLVREVYREAMKLGAHVEYTLDFKGMAPIFYHEANKDQLKYINLLTEASTRDFDAYLYIRAPFNLKEQQGIDQKKVDAKRKAMESINKIYFERTASGDLKRSLCQFPTDANAQEAGMSYEEYCDFIFGACKLDQPDPIKAWKALGKKQQKIVDFLNQKQNIRYVTEGTDIRFNTTGRQWINSDGTANMPSGEVFTAPVEDSVEGHIRFSYPAIYMGHEVEGVELKVEKGEIVSWDAQKGKDFLDKIFIIPGSRRFGEAAIGTNYGVQKITKNILFDEKIGGSIHMAIGQSYKQCGGENESAIHWDMITDMKASGQIFADDELIYEKGKFIVEL
ncbi:MAG TPA: aminopeptidase [Saprospiraceae bacterium]|nr:aminopeptidase [Saprospiraceae bacterium]